ncbi:MAG: hypothetical protein IRZ05_08030 [Micromonosporaceae bacterium]|jgi:hypothetical protein|nr:hypothetical protein [Micromonosporaceae bacterium]
MGAGPYRDERGRLASLGSLLGFALAGFVFGLGVLVLLDVVLAALGVSRFGRANGWLAIVLPVWLLTEEFRAWRGQPGRVVVALVGVALAVALGILANAIAGDLAPLARGASGAAVAIAAYSLVWYYGIRWMARP